MNYFRMHSLYFVKGINYQGASFSLISVGYPKISIFADLSHFHMEPYAINAIVAHNMMAGMIPNGKQLDFDSYHDIEERMKIKADENSAQGVYIEVINQCQTDIELVHISEVSGKLDPANLHPIPQINPEPNAQFIIYGDGEKVSVGSIQNEFDKEIARFERENADEISMLMIKQEVYGIKKLSTALSIITNTKTILLNQINVSMTSELTISIDDPLIMLDKIIKTKDIAKHIDGLLLMQSVGYNTDTPYARFMSAWVLLEKFIEKYFSTFDDKFILYESKSTVEFLNARTQSYIKSICINTNKIDIYKFNIVDKFIICCSASKIKLTKCFIDLFLSIKKTRDDHHRSVDEKDSFPTWAIFQILQRFFS